MQLNQKKINCKHYSSKYTNTIPSLEDLKHFLVPDSIRTYNLSKMVRKRMSIFLLIFIQSSSILPVPFSRYQWNKQPAGEKRCFEDSGISWWQTNSFPCMLIFEERGGEQRMSLKMKVTKKQSTPSFSKIKHFLLPDIKFFPWNSPFALLTMMSTAS